MIFVGYREVSISWTHHTWLTLLNSLDTYTALFVRALGDIDGMINSAKSLLRNANSITNEVLDGLNPIQTDVERIKGTYGSTQSEDFNKALTDADNSGISILGLEQIIQFSPLLCALVDLNSSLVKCDLRNQNVRKQVHIINSKSMSILLV